MSCLIRRNAKGNITGVTTPTGENSQLFEEIHGNVFMGDAETSVKITSLAYSESIQRTFSQGAGNTYSTGEPILHYQSQDKEIFTSIEGLLVAGKSGEVQAGFVNPKSGFFIPAVKFSTNATKNTQFITDQILEGTLSPRRILGLDGVTRLQGKGEYTDTKIGTAVLFQYNAKVDMAMGNVKVNKKDGTIEMGVPNDLAITENKDGDFDYISLSEIPQKADSYENAAKLKAIHRAISGATRPDNKNASKAAPLDEKSIARSLHNFLASLGFTETSLEAYRARFNTVYGKDPDIQAMADISNRVVAFANGQVTMDKLSEEVAHVAIEAYSDQNSIVTALSTVHLTPEYAESSEYYRTKYSPFFTGAALEEQVRKEILGKILAKEFTSRFSALNRGEEGKNLVDSLRSIWDAFIQFIKSRLKPYHVRALNDLNKKIADNVIGNNMENFQYDLSSSNAFFYSAMSPNHQSLHQSLLRSKKILEDALRAESRTNPDKFALEKIQAEMGAVNLVDSVNTIVGIVDRKVAELDRELRSLKTTTMGIEILSRQGENIASSLQTNLIPLIKSMKSDLSTFLEETEITDPKIKAKLQSTIKIITESINTLILKEAEIQPLIDKDKENVAKREFDAAIKTDDMSKEQYEKQLKSFKGAAETAAKDYGVVGKKFGLMTESRNVVLRLIAQKIQQMGTAINMQFVSETKEALRDIIKKGLQKFETKIIKEGSDGKNSHYIRGAINYAKYDEDFQNKRIEILSKITGKNKEEVTKLLTKYTTGEILGTVEEKLDQYTNEIKEWMNSKKVRQFLTPYYEKKAENFEKHKISKSTQETIKNFGARAAEINRPHMNDAGQIDRSTMTPLDIEALNRIKKEKEIVKSPFDQANEIKVGLKIVKRTDLTAKEESELSYKPSADYKGDLVIVAEGFSIEELTEESRVALDMNNLAYGYMFGEDKVGGGASEQFINKVQELEQKAATGEITYEAVFQWVSDNATISLSDKYYKNLDTIITYDESVERYLSNIYEPDESRRVSNYLSEYRKLNQTRKYLLKQNKKFGSSLDVNVPGMDEKTRLRLLELEDEIASIRKRIALPEEFQVAGESTTSSELNEDFYIKAKEVGLSHEGGIYTFALQHMTHTNKVRTEQFARELEGILFESRGSMNQYFEVFMEELDDKGIINDQMTREQAMRVAKDEFAKRNVAGYYKKFIPSNYNAAIESIKKGEVKLSDILKDKDSVAGRIEGLENIEINPDHTWRADINADNLLNPDYKKGEYHQQLNDEYLDKTWFDHYGISVSEYKKLSTDDISQLKATKNIEEFSYLQAYMGFREKAIANYGDTDKVNKWQRVQISKTRFEGITTASSLLNVGNLTKDALKDFTNSRVDEKQYGEELEGVSLIQEGSTTNIRSIPKYFQHKLEDPAIVSENTLSSVLLDLKESIVYAERVKTERDVRALMHQITKQKFVQSGISMKGRVTAMEGQVSEMHAKAKEYIDHHLYGVQQSRPLFATIGGREVDFTKIITNVQNFTRFSNLGYNLFVDLTGATTGFINNIMDRITGDYYHKSSVNRANSQATTMLPAYLKEITKLDRSSKLGQILELMGVDDTSSRVRESKAGRVGRWIKNSPYYFSRLSNMAISPKIALATLNDHRFYDGEFLSFETFVHRKTNTSEKQMSMKDVEIEWATLKNESLFDHLDFTKDGITYNQKFKDKIENPKEVFQDIISKVSAKAQKVIMNSDMVLNDADRVAAQRDVLTNTLLMHRGWMIINLTRKFKSEFYNISTGRYEEGQYISLVKIIGATLRTVRGKENVVEFYKNMGRHQKKNLNRVAVEGAILTALLILGEALLAGDDDDDTAAENLLQLIYLRTVSEFNSSTALGISGSITEAASSPLPALNTYKLLNVFTTIPSFFENNAEGDNKGVKSLVKNSILRRAGQYSDLQKQVDAFRHFNDPTLWNLGEAKKGEEEPAMAGQNPLNSIRIN